MMNTFVAIPDTQVAQQQKVRRGSSASVKELHNKVEGLRRSMKEFDDVNHTKVSIFWADWLGLLEEGVKHSNFFSRRLKWRPELEIAERHFHIFATKWTEMDKTLRDLEVKWRAVETAVGVGKYDVPQDVMGIINNVQNKLQEARDVLQESPLVESVEKVEVFVREENVQWFHQNMNT
jgi:hypothetical protein